MPPRGELGLDCFTAAEELERATHEDYTIKMLVDSDLTDAFQRGFGDMGISPKTIAHLITGRYPDCGPSTEGGGD